MTYNLRLKAAGDVYPDWELEAEAPDNSSVRVQDGIAGALLGTDGTHSPYLLMTGVACLYAAVLLAAVTIDFQPPPAVLEAPVEMVYDDPTPEQPEQAQPPAPPPPEEVKEAEAIEPVKEPPPPPPEVKKDPPKPKPQAAARHTPNAIPSNYTNQIFQRINRIASGNYPRSALAQHQSARVGYTIVIGQSGELISRSISPSGNSALDQSVLDTLSRSAPFPAPPNLGARSYKISGAIVFRIE
jgi:protein TonB